RFVDHEIARDAEDVRAELLRLDLGAVDPDAEKGFLRHVVGGFAVVQQSRREGEDRPPVQGEQVLESETVAGGEARDERRRLGTRRGACGPWCRRYLKRVKRVQRWLSHETARASGS